MQFLFQYVFCLIIVSCLLHYCCHMLRRIKIIKVVVTVSDALQTVLSVFAFTEILLTAKPPKHRRGRQLDLAFQSLYKERNNGRRRTGENLRVNLQVDRTLNRPTSNGNCNGDWLPSAIMPLPLPAVDSGTVYHLTLHPHKLCLSSVTV